MSFQVMKKKFFIQCLFLVIYSYSFSQTYTMNNGSNTGVSKCTGIFVDSGGSGTDYTFNESSTITFCPVVPTDKIKISFTSFDTEDDGSGGCYDYLDVWYANAVGASGTQKEELCGTLSPFSIISTSAGGCISLKFTSDGFTNKAGWVANISCITPCSPPTAALKSNSTVDICSPSASNPGSLLLPFDASNSTTPSGSITKYEWDWGDGKKETTTTPTTTHLFPSQGIFVVKLSVRNSNTTFDPLGCQSTNSATQVIRVLPPPNFTGTTSSPLNISCGASITLNGVITSQTIAQATPSAVSSTTSLPDGSGSSFNSGIDYTGFFPSGAKVSPGCYPTLTFNIEHSYSGDLSIDLIAPSGQTVRVYNDNFGNSNMFGACSNYNDDGVPGCGASYSVVNSGAVNWPAEGTSGTTKTSKSCSTYTGPCYAGNYYIPKTYNSANSFSGFNGADLNGIWTIRITDNLQYDDGTLFSWSLSFPKSCYINLESVTPNLPTASVSWTHSGTGPTIPAHTTTSSSVTNPGPDSCPSGSTCVGNKLTNAVAIGPFSSVGSFIYNLNAKDQFGCEYINPVTVNVTCSCPTASINYATNSFCSSDTNVKTVTLTGNGAYTGGTYSSKAGLTINATTGAITPSTSTPGTYSVNYTIPASSGCGIYVASTTITIITTTTAPSFTLIQPSCTLSTGTATISGIVGETYSFDGGSYTSNLVYSGLLAGSSHTINSKNSDGCISSVSNFTINTSLATPSAPTITVLQPSCIVSTGTITITGSTGETYSFDSGPYTSTLIYAGLAAGSSHSIYAKNSSGCISSITTSNIDVQPASPSAPTINTTQPTCSVATGTVTITGVIGETYSFDSGSYTPSLVYSGLLAGSSHTIYAKNLSGCISPVTNVTLNNQPVTLNIPTVTITQPSCTVATGSITILPVVGETYSFDSGSYNSTLTYNGLLAGSSHTLTAKDSGGCISPIGNFVLNSQPATPAAPTITLDQPNCDVATGTVIIKGISGETYSFDSAPYSQNFVYNDVAASSTHTIFAKNAVGCISLGTTIVLDAQPATPIVTATPNTSSICSGDTTAIVLSSNIIGTSFSWNAVQINVSGTVAGSGDSIAQTLTATSNKIGEAVYVVTPTLNGCSGVPVVVNIKVNPIPIVSAKPNQETLCSGATTNIALTSSVTGTTFSWTVVQTGVIGTFDSTGTTINQTLKTFGAIQGTVDYAITPRSNGCAGIPNTITVKVNPTPEVFGPTGANICSGESTAIVLTPNILGTQFGWTVNQIGVTGATDGKGDTINQILEAGTTVGTALYTITPFLEECSGKPITSIIKVNPSPIPIVTDGTICVKQNTNTTFKSYTIETGLNNTNYDFEWYLNHEKIIGSTSNSSEAVVEGLYSVIVTNKTTNCNSKETFVSVTPNYPADSFTATVSDAFAQDATVIVTELGGTGPFLYQIDDGPLQSSNVFSGLSSGTHSVRIQDEQGCTSLSQDITVIDYPKYFTPNGDGINDTWNIKGLTNQPDAKIFIFDRYGKLIKQIETTGKGWDGVFNGHLLPAEDYWFTVEYVEANVNKLFKAHFSLKR